MRLAIFGGSFDPPHIGHLLVAQDAIDALELTRLIFVPAAVQPLKPTGARASPAERFEMVKRLVADDPRFGVDPIEIERPGLSYTVETLETFARRFPEATRFFLVGADVLGTFAAWREPERILALAQLVILRRPGVGKASETTPDGARSLVTRLVDVSSTEIRERVRTGRSIRGFVPESVAGFIETKQLYR